MILREVAKIVTEKEYDDVDRNRIVDVHIESKFKVFGIRLFKRVFNEKLDTVDGVVIHAKQRKRDSKIIVLNTTEMTADTTKFTIVSIAENITDIKVGDEVFAAGAAFIPLEVSDMTKDEAYFYCPSMFIKMYKRDES